MPAKATTMRHAEAVNQTVTCDLPEIATDLAVKVVAMTR